MLGLHKWKLLFLALAANLALVGSLISGEIKPAAQWNWLDIISEGGLALLALSWLLLILHSRPSGRVTQYLSLGLSAIFIAGLQDWLDEFIYFPDNALWDHWVESGFMPIGLILLTLGIYHWHKEQLLITEQLRKRERLFREHRGLDSTTNLSGATYLRQQLEYELNKNPQQNPLALVFIDIDNFSQINRHYGKREGDSLLHALGELLLLNIRHNDLLCRYAGDRFALLLPNTGRLMATSIANELSQAVRHFAFKSQQQQNSIFHSVSIGIAFSESANTEKDTAAQDPVVKNTIAKGSTTQDSAENLISRATQSLLQAKQLRDQQTRHAA